MRVNLYDACQTAPTNAVCEGQIENSVYRLSDLATRLENILNDGDAVIDRRYGPRPPVAGGSGPVQPGASGSFFALQAVVDRMDRVIDRTSAVVARLGEA